MASPTMLHEPFRLAPFLRPMVWGGRRLETVLKKPLPTAEKYGESWEVSDHASHHSTVAGGANQGKNLHDLMTGERQSLLGRAADKYTDFPWLIKFIDAADWLSVQVHPSDEAAVKLWPGERGKSEAWFILDVQPGSKIYAGLLPGVDEKQLRAALASGTVAECLNEVSPKPGECYYYPAGTVHAVGGGVLLAEVQQTSDATFRLFDWNRKDAQGKSRQLHIDEAIACIDLKRGPVQPVRVSEFTSPTAASPSRVHKELVRCKYFNLDYVKESAEFTFDCKGTLRAMIILRGHGHWSTGGQQNPIRMGEVWVLPAEMTKTACRPEAELEFLLCTLPD